MLQANASLKSAGIVNNAVSTPPPAPQSNGGVTKSVTYTAAVPNVAPPKTGGTATANNQTPPPGPATKSANVVNNTAVNAVVSPVTTAPVSNIQAIGKAIGSAIGIKPKAPASVTTASIPSIPEPPTGSADLKKPEHGTDAQNKKHWWGWRYDRTIRIIQIDWYTIPCSSIKHWLIEAKRLLGWAKYYGDTQAISYYTTAVSEGQLAYQNSSCYGYLAMNGRKSLSDYLGFTDSDSYNGDGATAPVQTAADAAAIKAGKDQAYKDSIAAQTAYILGIKGLPLPSTASAAEKSSYEQGKVAGVTQEQSNAKIRAAQAAQQTASKPSGIGVTPASSSTPANSSTPASGGSIVWGSPVYSSSVSSLPSLGSDMPASSAPLSGGGGAAPSDDSGGVSSDTVPAGDAPAATKSYVKPVLIGIGIIAVLYVGYRSFVKKK